MIAIYLLSTLSLFEFPAKTFESRDWRNKRKNDTADWLIGQANISDEKRLVKLLLDNYEQVGVIGRPVRRSGDVINVNYGLALIQILGLDERNQVLTTNCWGRYVWTDYLLSWDPGRFGGQQTIRVPASKIWTPDIVLYNYADDRLEEYRRAHVVVYYDGTVLWIPQAIFKSSCVIDITRFPFDSQVCRMKFGSWTYDGYLLDVNFYENVSAFDLNDYIESNEWSVTSSKARKNVKRYPCCQEPYPDLTFSLTLRRKVAFYNYILILPCVLLSSLTLILFWLPPESPAKMVLGINIFVAFFVLLLLLAESTPPAASSIPLIGAYYCTNMVLITLSTFLSVVVVNLYFRGEMKRSPVPQYLRKIFFGYLARILCMHGDLKITQSKPSKPTHIGRVAAHYVSDDYVTCRLAEEPTKSPTKPQTSLESDVAQIRKYMLAIANRIQIKEHDAIISEEWKMLALILDRLFFYAYLFIILISLMIVFPYN